MVSQWGLNAVPPCHSNLPYLIILGRSGVEGPSQEQFRHHAAQRPHIDSLAERQAQNDLWSTVIPRLQVRIAHRFTDMRCTPEINHFYPKVDEKGIIGYLILEEIKSSQ